jgi:dTDP-4-amino-4,6-dideoxygalactose transaminase
MHSRVPFYSLEPQHKEIRSEVLKSLEAVFDRQQFVMGEALLGFEADYARFTGTGYCAGVASGLDAITLSLRALGIQVGDEVIVPSHTFIATWLAVSAVGATIVPVEPDLATYNIDCGKIEAAITGKTRAIIPVHLYGQSCDMRAVMAIAARHKLLVVEDNAQAHGARFNGRNTGSFGHCNATSFYPVKNLGALGDAGAVTTADREIFERVISLRNYGAVSKSVYEATGVNSRLDELQAAVLQVKLGFVERWNEERAAIARTYAAQLKGVGDLIIPATVRDCTHVYHQFVIRTSKRDALREYLSNEGVGTMIHYPVPPHLQNAYASLGFRKGSLPVAEEIAASCLSLPVWPGMTDDQVEFVIRSIREFWNS